LKLSREKKKEEIRRTAHMVHCYATNVDDSKAILTTLFAREGKKGGGETGKALIPSE